MTISTHWKDHKQIHLWHEGKRVARSIHRLVMQYFGPTMPKDKPLVCHIDGNPKNNCISNLRWDDMKGNHFDKHIHGTAQIGERANNSKLTNAQARTIRKKYGTVFRPSILVIAREYSVGPGVIARLLRNESYKKELIGE